MAVRHPRAFSLIELVVVVAIVAVIAAIAIPRVGGVLRQQRLSAAARRVVADLTLAATKARASGSSRTVVFKPAAGTYAIAGEASLASEGGDYVVDLGAAPYEVTIAAVDFNSTATATFDGYGRAMSGGYVVVQSDGATRRIALSADTGKAVIE